MRNLILLAATFAIALSETDVEQLGYDVTKEDFLSYFGIDESTHVNNENFSPMDNSVYMTAEEEKAVHDKFMVKKAKAKGITKKDDQAKADKADEKAAGASKKPTQTKEEKEKAKAEAKAAREKAKAEKAANKPVKEKVIGVIGTIQQILTDATEPISQEQIYEALQVKFPEKGETMKKTVYCQLSGKEQPLRMEKEKGVKIELTVKEETVDEKIVKTKLYRIIPA